MVPLAIATRWPLLISFIATKVRKEVDQLMVDDITAERLRLFLQDLEQTRGCSVATRNQRLAMVHALARFTAEHSPEHIEWCGAIRTIPFKKAMKRDITYLEKAEMDALLAAPDRRTPQGQRDYALLLFLYNTGARADEGGAHRAGDRGHRRAARAQRGDLRPSDRTKFQVVAVLARQERARVRAEISNDARRSAILKRLDGIALTLAQTATRDTSLLALLAEDSVLSDTARTLARNLPSDAAT